jgi:enoyl-CoA hydratase/carnithine racemase
MAIHGRCWGGGLQIALGGDFRIVTPDASIAIMEARWGLIPDMGGTIALRELVTKAVATELAMTGQIISGQQALSYGLVSHVEEKPLEKAQQMAELICQQSPDAVAASKKLYNKSWFGFSGFALARESYYQFKILLGKNSKIKAYNQTHQKDVQKVFVDRKPW